MLKKLAVVAAVIAVAALAVAPIGSAKPADPGKGGRCIAAGLGTLVGLGLVEEAARGEVDYAPLGLNGAGLIRVALPAGSFLPLSTVIGLHRTNPELFAWCDNV